jgi:hypothetical protein
MTCPACTAFAADPLSGRYETACRACAARYLARSPAFFAARRVDVDGPERAAYRELLHSVGARCTPRITHAEVLAAAA